MYDGVFRLPAIISLARLLDLNLFFFQKQRALFFRFEKKVLANLISWFVCLLLVGYTLSQLQKK